MTTSQSTALWFADADAARNPFPHYEALRQRGPVHFLPRQGFWLVVGFEEIQAALAQPLVFSNRVDPWQQVDRILLGADPPGHTAARRAIAAHFSAPTIQAHAAVAERTAEALLAPFAAGGRPFDVLREFSTPLAEDVAAHFIGFDADALARMRASRPPHLGYWLAALDALIAAQASRMPLYEQLSRAGEGAFDAAGARSLIRMLWIAGTTTTRRAIASSVLMLLRNPASRERVEADPTLLGAFFDETIRLHPPEHTLARVTTAEVELGGVRLPAGATVRLCVAAGNRDPARFEQPDSLLLERANGRKHLSFGGGIHRCVGAVLAHAEATAALRALLRVAPRFRSTEPPEALPFAGFANDAERLVIEC